MNSGSALFYGGKKVAYVPYVVEWAKKNKLLVAKKNAKRGDIVIFNFGGRSRADHIGLCDTNYSNGAYMKTIEGNTSVTSNDNGGKVMRRTRSYGLISYVIRPKWNTTYTARCFYKIAAAQLGVAEKPSGSNKCKYSDEYGLRGPWCCMFIWWCFKHMPKATPSTYPLLKYGKKSVWVGKAKKLLHKKGYKGLNLTNGLNVFGKGTLKAVKKFQKDNKLKVDGQVGPKTWKMLCK